MSDLARQALTIVTDVELAGDILRVVTDGLPELKSRDAADALLELRTKHEPFRDFLNLPPHGSAQINSSLLYPAFGQEADGTLFLASQFAYAPYAGTALMAAATALAEGKDQVWHNSWRTFTFETALGVMKVELTRKNGTVTEAKWCAAVPRLIINNEDLHLSPGRAVPVSVVDTGLPYLVVDVSTLGFALSDEQRVSEAAVELSAAAAEQFPMTHLGMSESYSNYLVMCMSKVAEDHIKAVWVSDRGVVARSAGGTGALSVLAACEGNGCIAPGQLVLIEAPGGGFLCQITEQKASVSAKVMIIAKRSFPPIA